MPCRSRGTGRRRNWIRRHESPVEFLPRAQLGDAFGGGGVLQVEYIRRDLLDGIGPGELRELLQRGGLDVGALDDQVHNGVIRDL